MVYKNIVPFEPGESRGPTLLAPPPPPLLVERPDFTRERTASMAVHIELPVPVLQQRLSREQFNAMLMDKKALISDLDGTAYSSHEAQRDACVDALALAFGRGSPCVREAQDWVMQCFDNQSFNGMIEGIFQRLVPLPLDRHRYPHAEALDESLNSLRLDLVMQAVQEGRVPAIRNFTNFVRLVVKARGLTLGINTSSPKEIAFPMMKELVPLLIEASKRQHKIFRNQHTMLQRRFRRMVGLEEHEFRKKPFTDSYDALVHKMEIDKSQAIILEDCPHMALNLLLAGYGQVILVLPEKEDQKAARLLSGLTEEQASRLVIARDFSLLIPDLRKVA